MTILSTQQLNEMEIKMAWQEKRIKELEDEVARLKRPTGGRIGPVFPNTSTFQPHSVRLCIREMFLKTY